MKPATFVPVAAVVCLITLAVHLPAQEKRGWTIPEGASDEANPVPSTPDAVKKGAQLYGINCERCHGPEGKGDGMDGDPDHPPGDLTDPKRAARNPDGVIFYRVWNGRTNPKMPAFKDELSKEDVWTIVHYVQTLRRKGS
jgi:copper resistance protein D